MILEMMLFTFLVGYIPSAIEMNTLMKLSLYAGMGLIMLAILAWKIYKKHYLTLFIHVIAFGLMALFTVLANR